MGIDAQPVDHGYFGTFGHFDKVNIACAESVGGAAALLLEEARHFSDREARPGLDQDAAGGKRFGFRSLAVGCKVCE
jgi:hypothetical protein